MALWWPRIVEKARFTYLGVVELLDANIPAGRVHPSKRLPSHQAIAETLNVDLTTVARAFDEVRRRDLVDAWIGVALLEIWGKGKAAIVGQALEQYRIRWNHLIRGFAFLNKDLERVWRFSQRRTRSSALKA